MYDNVLLRLVCELYTVLYMYCFIYLYVNLFANMVCHAKQIQTIKNNIISTPKDGLRIRF